MAWNGRSWFLSFSQICLKFCPNFFTVYHIVTAGEKNLEKSKLVKKVRFSKKSKKLSDFLKICLNFLKSVIFIYKFLVETCQTFV
jgi:hypothetical protein